LDWPRQISVEAALNDLELLRHSDSASTMATPTSN
jgi:hypothetical protein